MLFVSLYNSEWCIHLYILPQAQERPLVSKEQKDNKK